MFIVLIVLLYSFAVFWCIWFVSFQQMLQSVQIALLLVDILVFLQIQSIHIDCMFIFHSSSILASISVPGSLGWVTTSAHKKQSLCGRQNLAAAVGICPDFWLEAISKMSYTSSFLKDDILIPDGTFQGFTVFADTCAVPLKFGGTSLASCLKNGS